MPLPPESVPDSDNDTNADALEDILLAYLVLEQRRLELLLKECALTPAQYAALRHLAQRRAGCAMGELAEALGHGMATTTGLVDRLVRGGLARRQRHPQDRRVVLVSVTEPGHAALARARALRRRQTMTVLAAWPAEERRRLFGLLSAYLRQGG